MLSKDGIFLIHKMQPWIIKSLGVGGGRVFSGELLEKMCFEDLKVDPSDEAREVLRVALSMFNIYRTPSGDYYGCFPKDESTLSKKVKRASKKS